MAQESRLFGEELRRRRLSEGLSIAQLAQRVHYSKSQLSKVERGIKRPSTGLARLCDAALRADGTLASLAREGSCPSDPETDGGSHPVGTSEDVSAWLMHLSVNGENWVRPLSRRQTISAATLTIPGIVVNEITTLGKSDTSAVSSIFQNIFEHYRKLGQITDPALLVPALIAQTHTLQELSKNSAKQAKEDLLALGSRYAEYAGWLIQETGNDHLAMWWTGKAIELAEASGDSDFAAYGLVRQALVTMYSRDAQQTIQLARSATVASAPTRIRGLAAVREAQGHALATDYGASMKAIDCASKLLSEAAEDARRPIIGTQNLSDPAEMVRGWCLLDLGRPQMAAEIFDRQLATIPPEATRAHVRFGARRALAYAAAGEVEHACMLATGLLDDVSRVQSATIATDLRALLRTLGRYQANPSVRELFPRLSTAAHAQHTNESRHNVRTGS